MHQRTANCLSARTRFRRVQRICTSDGDATVHLGEKILDCNLSNSTAQHLVPTLRAKCVVHRVYHTITHGMGFVDTYLTGQIRLALSLKGPGHFTQFKTLFWNYLLGNYQYVAEVPFRGAGAEADSHRTTSYTTVFPSRRGRNQRRNRLKYFVIQKLANGDVRIAGTFWHFCKLGCCHNEADFKRKLKWLVCIACGKLVICFPRGRWTGMEAALDFVGLLSSIHSLLPIIYGIWFKKVTGKEPPKGFFDVSFPPAPPVPDRTAEGGIADPYDVSDITGGADQKAKFVPKSQKDKKQTAKEESPDDPKKRIQDRSIASRFVSSPSLGPDTIGIRICSMGSIHYILGCPNG